MNRKAKTQGLEWLVYSLTAFNGTGYADMDSAEDFLDSYVAYKTMRKKHHAVRLVQLYKLEILPMVEELLRTTHGAGQLPNEKGLAKFQAFRKQTQGQLNI